MKDGVPQPDVLAKWAANAPLAFIDQYIDNLREYRAIAMDVGDQDGLRIDDSKAARRPGQIWDRQQLRDLPGNAHQRGR